MAKIYYIGDWAVLTGPVFAESPFNYAHKGLDIFNYGKWLKEALESDGRHEVTSVASWDFYNLPPGRYEQILADYDAFIFSDVEAKLFQLNPHFFDREKFGKKILTFPDRIRLTIEAIQGGKKAMFLGGWLSYTGEKGKGGWGRTRLSEILPVGCLDHEDLVESTEGFRAVSTQGSRAHFAGIDFSTFPPILGYNKTTLHTEGEILLEIAETGDPLLAVRTSGQGSVLSYMSDPAPHWGCNFVYWEHYKKFWLDCFDLL
jgi:uncharacterized membrane protein